MRKRKAAPAIALCLAAAMCLGGGAAFADEPPATVPEAPAAEAAGALSGAAEASYTVSYEFKSSVAWRTLNQEVKDLLPAAQADVADGTRVVPPAPAATEVRGDGGVWRFQGWDKAEATVDGADVRFVGTWKMEQYKPLFADYHFSPSTKSGAAGHDRLPKEVLDLLPAPIEGLKDGDVVHHPQPARTEVEVDGGKWVFDGWPMGDTSVMKGNLGTYASWTFVEDAPAPATAKRVQFSVHLLVDGGRDYPDAALLGEMKPALVSADGARVEPSRILANGFTFEFADVPEGEYTLEFSLPQGYRFAAGETASMGAYVDSGSRVQVKAGNVVRNFYTRLQQVPATLPPAGPAEPDGKDGAGKEPPRRSVEGGGNSGQRGRASQDPSKKSGPASSVKALPKTGDESGIAALAAAGAACAAAASLALARRARRDRESED
ncbi:MAG: DUF1731 domain-containing protein [Coriobacteriaceae bacterium]|nr:DUF1731 domain-containing protein [Coriobacteriaceae bacterium]